MVQRVSINCLSLGLIIMQTFADGVTALDRLAQDPVTVRVGVLNQETGKSVLNLGAEDFVIEENGERQKATRFLHEERPLSILLLIDASGSMRPIVHPIIEALSRGLKQLRPDDEVGLMCYNEQVYVLQDFTRNKGLVEEKLKVVVAQRPTHTRQAIFQASTHLQKATAAESRRVMVVLTDNLSSIPRGDISERVVMQQLSASDTVACGVIVPNPVHLLPPGAIVPKPTGDITPYVEETGGIIETVKNVAPEEISTRVVKTIDALRDYYRIEYRPTNSKRDGKHRKIKVTLSSSAKKTGGRLTVLAKRGYFAPDDSK